MTTVLHQRYKERRVLKSSFTAESIDITVEIINQNEDNTISYKYHFLGKFQHKSDINTFSKILHSMTMSSTSTPSLAFPVKIFSILCGIRKNKSGVR